MSNDRVVQLRFAPASATTHRGPAWRSVSTSSSNSPPYSARLAFELGRRVRELREQRGWNQTQLARQVGTGGKAQGVVVRASDDPYRAEARLLTATRAKCRRQAASVVSRWDFPVRWLVGGGFSARARRASAALV